MSTSKYAQAWAVLKQYKILVIVLDTPRVEKTVRQGIIEHKKLDKDKNLLERIKVTKRLTPENKLELTFTLHPVIRTNNEYFDL